MAVDALRGFSPLVLVDTRRPVGFFAYPGQPSLLADPGTSILAWRRRARMRSGRWTELADLVGAPAVGLGPRRSNAWRCRPAAR